jgi:hypothetical protein
MHTGKQTFQLGFAMRSIFSLIISASIVTCPASLDCQAVPKVLYMITPDFPEGISAGGFVICEVFLLSNGKIGMATAIQGVIRLQSAAETALSSWLFEPSKGNALRRVLVSFTFYPTSYSGLKNQVVVELIPERGLPIRLGPRVVLPLVQSLGKAPATVCEVHDQVLRVDIVSVGYGLVLPRPAFERAKNSLFPHSNRYVLGGCVVQPENAAVVLYCPKCRKAEAHWQKAHPMRE